jgi:hypothetical protein
VLTVSVLTAIVLTGAGKTTLTFTVSVSVLSAKFPFYFRFA